MNDFKNIPDTLKAQRRWVGWNMVERDGRLTKAPVNARTGGGAQSNNSSTWSDFSTALSSVDRYGLNGVGFMLGDGFIGVDIDHCRDESGGFTDEAFDIIDTLNSYTEMSQSGQGVHVICQGSLPYGQRRRGNIEMYESRRFFVMTGEILDDDHREVQERTSELQAVHEKYLKPAKKTQTENRALQELTPLDLNDDELIEKIMGSKQKDLFVNLMNGDAAGYASASEADLALCNILAFWTQKDEAAMDRIYRRSGLYRPKWDRVNDGTSTYGQLTIWKSVADCVTVYNPPVKNKKSNAPAPPPQFDTPPIEVYENFIPDNTDPKGRTVTSSVDFYRCTDVGNSEKFAELLKGEYLFVPEQKLWYRYNGKFWEEDIDNRIVQDIILSLRKYQTEALNISDADRRDKILKWLLSSESQKRINSALNLMSSIPYMIARINQFDKDPMLLNALNGTVNLRTGSLLPHKKDDYITKICRVNFVPHASSNVFNSFLDDILERSGEKKHYLQKLSGYCCTGMISEEEFYQALGVGQNGKTKLFETIKYCLGSYAITASPDILMARDMASIPNDIARLQGARFVLMSEPDPGKRFSDNAVKSLTGGDTIIARFLHKEFFEFRMQGKIIMLTNHEIKAIGTDHGLWRRIVVIPFTYQVPELKRDKNLQQKLIEDAEAVLSWMIQGCLLWQNEGLKQPEELERTKNEYRRGQDAIGTFLEEMTFTDPNAQINATDLYNAYVSWCEINGEHPISQRLFGSRLREKGFSNLKVGFVFWLGLDLLDKLDNLDKKQTNKNKSIYI